MEVSKKEGGEGIIILVAGGGLERRSTAVSVRGENRVVRYYVYAVTAYSTVSTIVSKCLF